MKGISQGISDGGLQNDKYTKNPPVEDNVSPGGKNRREMEYLEAISKKRFWFKIKAGPSFHAKPDGPSDFIVLVGLNPQAYSSISRT